MREPGAIQLGTYKEKKKGCLTAFLDEVQCTCCTYLLGEGAEPSIEVVNGGEEFLCSLFCPKQLHISQENNLGWHLIKQLKLDEGVDKLTPAYSGCLQMQDGKLLSLLTKEASAPEAALQLIICNCVSTNVESTSKCSRRCPCKRNDIQHRNVQLCRRWQVSEHRANRNWT